MSRRARNRRPAAVPVGYSRPSPLSTGLTRAIVIGGAAVIVLLALTRAVRGRDFRAATIDAACRVTGCAPAGLTVTGFLMALSPLLYGGATALLWRRARRAGRTVLVAGGVLLLGPVVMFLPQRRYGGIAALVDGSAGEALARGMTWGVSAMFAAGAVCMAAAIASSRFTVRPAAIWTAAGVVMVTLLVVAATSAPSGRTTAAQIFPELSLRVNDDVLTRQWSEDRSGCERIVADTALLDGCLRTAEFQFTTTDSDAVVRFSAVVYPTNDAAWDAWGRFRDRTRAAGVDGDALVLPEVTNEWLTVAVVRHADGRAITAADRRWLPWPAKQLRYAFARAVGYSIAPVPAPTGSIAPSSTP